MYLKCIEIQGFKSFANKITFEFHNGITGIVGPNGSGKSNVADAVRWVLGEQRVKQLRGGSMQDVIFSGTEMRKPQGFAYVAITLDNSDHQLAIEYDEVTISRRLYRSGESEYMLNGSACRLKDVNELFYDTGIGKEGYSIIGQGQIDKILSGKPEERRELFDEAAGIVKFKRRKAIAQKKLEDEKQNLIRVSDILAELEKQVGPLKKQSEAAREYLKFKEDLKNYDVNLFLLESDGIKKQLDEVEQKTQIVSDDLNDVNTTSEKIKTEYNELETEIEGLNELIDKSKSDLNDSTVLTGNLKGQINVLLEQINTEKMNEEHINSRRDAITEELRNKDTQSREYEIQNSDTQEQLTKAVDSQKAAEDTLRKTDEEIMLLDQNINKSKSSMIDTLNEKAELNARQQRFEAMLEQVNIRKSEVCQKLLKIKSDESAQDLLIAQEQKKLDEINEKINSLSLSGEEVQSDVNKYEQEVSRLTRNINETQQEYQTIYTKMDSLKNLAERYDGYGNSIRRVMEVRDRIKGIHGVVADLITVDKQYETAIETALGGSIQNVVTDSDQTAKLLIEHLKKNKYGRATFLPLTSIGNKNTFNQEQALKEHGVIGLASTLVQANSQYDGLVKYLLGRVVVVDNIDNAISLAKKYNHSLRIVTVEGELLSAGGSISGGAFKNSSNLLGRKREIEELEEACKKALDQAEKIQTDLSANEAMLAEQKEILEDLKAKLQAEYINQNTIKMNISQLDDKKSEIADAGFDLSEENKLLEDQIQEIDSNKNKLGNDIVVLDGQNDQVNDDIKLMAQKLEDLKSSRNDYAEALSHAQVKTSNLKQQHSFVVENINRLKQEMDKLLDERSALNNGTNDTNRIIEEKQHEIDKLEKTIDDTNSKLSGIQALIEEHTVQKEEKSKLLKDSFQKREEISTRISQLDKELFRLQNQKEKLDEKLDGIVSYMWEEYELTYSSAEELKDESMVNLSEIKKTIDTLKNSIRNLGNVNVNAIEDYKEVSERYEFMNTQHEDLIKAEETLMNIIDELDSGMRRQFEEKFGEIKKEFDKVFKELFGGGCGTLELMEDEDILEAGIQIISQPPGKKLQNMMQLSGGEKALTAIALLFAIQNLKPSPFCLLDEIEAALDDSNVDRFAGYLHKLTKYTQFIVITHRRGTMVSADRLYGITMQEKGVSTLVSVNLIENDLDK